MSAFSLEKEPFPEAGGREFYFSTPALSARLDELCDAIDRGNVLLLDEQASGKSTMLDSFTEAACERWRIFRLQARARIGAKEFVHELVSTFGLPLREPAAAALRDADTLLELFTTRSQIAVIIIDDAHRLEDSALDQLLYLAKRWQGYSVRFLICAETSLIVRLDSLHEGERFPGAGTTFGMPRFDHEQVSDYLHMCLFRAGLVGDSPFDPVIVATVTERARGLVGAIDPIARELLSDSSEKRRNQSCRDPQQATAWRWATSIVAAAGLGLLLTVAAPVFSTSQSEAEPRHHLEGFQSSITLAPGESTEDLRERSATADAAAP